MVSLCSPGYFPVLYKSSLFQDQYCNFLKQHDFQIFCLSHYSSLNVLMLISRSFPMWSHQTKHNTPDGISSEKDKNPVFLCLDIPLHVLCDSKGIFLRAILFCLFLSRHFIPGKTLDWHIVCSGRRIVSLNFQDKEEVENAVLKPVELESREEAILHSVASRGHSHKGVVPQDRRRWR